jgi:hypothetical protein
VKWFLRACPVCSGDLHESIEDDGWLQCFSCAREYEKAKILPHTVPVPSRKLVLKP